MKSNLFLVHCYTDNKSLADTINSISLTEKCLKADMCIIKEMIEKQEVTIVLWFDSSSQLAACITKVGTSSEKFLHVLKGKDKIINFKKVYVQ